jgi:hypothetical protein
MMKNFIETSPSFGICASIPAAFHVNLMEELKDLLFIARSGIEKERSL